MSTKKTIQINPELFRMSGSKKTKRNTSNTDLNIKPTISSTNLKNKLLNRIKEHRQQEFLNTNNKPKNKDLSLKTTVSNTNNDEFQSAINYLSDITRKQHINNTPKTLKQRPISKTNINSVTPILSGDATLTDMDHFKPLNDTVFDVHYKIDNNIPYGCLKGGKKNTYREWKSFIDPDDSVVEIIRPPTPPKKHNSSINESTNTNTLQNIKQRLKQIDDNDINNYNNNTITINADTNTNTDTDTDTNTDTNTTNDINNLFHEKQKEKIKKLKKKFIKTTTKKQFTLGKIKNKNYVSVLLKDNQTRKKILNTQKSLKKTNINDIKKYLRQHGMIKMGSTCPPDILRKTFECAMLSGEINNINKDVLMHNIIASNTISDTS